MPVSWSDNIYGVIGEELGLLGTLFVVLLFALLAYRGLRIALRAPDNFGMLLATGITTMLILQALLNMAVIVAAAPPTGVTLPFISYGGSSLVASLFGIGVLLSISRYGVENGARATEVGRYAYERLDLGRGDGRTRVPRTGGRHLHLAPSLRQAPASIRVPGSAQAPTSPAYPAPASATGASGAAATAEGEEVASSADSASSATGQPVQLLWAGSTGGMEQALVERAGIRSRGSAAASCALQTRSRS